MVIRHPPPEIVPCNMTNDNNNGDGIVDNHERPVRNPPPPPPPPEMVEAGPHNNPQPRQSVPNFSVREPRMFASHDFGSRAHTTRVMVLMPMQGPVPREFSRPFSTPLPSDLFPPNRRNQQDADRRTRETDYNDEQDPFPNDYPLNFALCKERFNGTGDVRPFINAILDFKYYCEMKDESAVRSLPLLLTDQAAHWWKANKTSVTDWNTAIKLLRDTFRPRTQQHKIYRRFFNAAHNEETTAEFVLKAKTLLNKIPVNTLTQETQLDLIFAMLHCRIKDNVNRDDCDTYMDLLERARQVEESMAAQASAPPNEPSEAQKPAAEKPVQPEELPADLEAASKQEPALETPASAEEPMKPDALTTQAPSSSSRASIPISDSDEPSEAPCDRCRIYGLLFERTCRKLHKGERSPQSIALLHELSKLDAAKFHKVVCFRCRSDNIAELKCQKCTHEIVGGYPLISISIFEVDFNFVVDTGSSHSVASSQLVEHLVTCGQEFAFNVLIMPIKGVPMRQVFRVANVDVMVAGVMIQTVLVDLPGATKSVFGMDFIKEAGLVMDFRGEGTWTVRGGEGEQPVFYDRSNRLERQY